MMKVLLAAVAGFTVAFVAGVVSAPVAHADPYIRCTRNADCIAFGAEYCGGDAGMCFKGSGTTGYCLCP
jgi:hypothetical protein